MMAKRALKVKAVKTEEIPKESGSEVDSDSSVYSELEDSEDDTSEDEASEKDQTENGDGEPSTSNQNNPSKVKLEKKVMPDEYQYDSSDEEDLRNTVGNIPLNWYDEYPHIGYNLDGDKILKPPADDEIQDFLKKVDDPNYWRTVKDKQTGQKVVLNDEDLNFIKRLQKGCYPTESDIYQPFEDIFSHEVMKHPVKSHPEHKRSFIPSQIEQQKVNKLVHAIKMGWIKPRQPKKEEEPQFYMLWGKDSDVVSKRLLSYIPAPKLKLPGHEESYNPPPEYLFTKEEEADWNEEEPEKRKTNFIPKKYSSLRVVPSYSNFFKERFDRCLDLYLCPRQRKMRANVDPNDLIPQLPKPRDLRPFPTVLSVTYSGHENIVRCITMESQGQFFASGSDDETVKIWEVLTGRCLRTFQVAGVVHSISWCPNSALCLLLVAVENKVLLINPGVGDKVVISNTDALLKSILPESEQEVVEWREADSQEWLSGIRVIVQHMKVVRQVTWHSKGDYFASLVPEALSKGVIIHRLSLGQSQMPFHKLKAKIQNIQFHPLRPFFFVATQSSVRVYNLLKQEMSKKLISNCQWISSMAIHPQGDNVIVGSYDCRLNWFDMDLSTHAYKTMKHHKRALRQVAFHKRYPLFASASDDGDLIVCHGMVYSDLLQNPLIVPVKVLKGHQTTHNLNILDCTFHPTQPWILSSGADATIRLYT